MTSEELAELRRANDLREREVTELKRIADQMPRPVQTWADWWRGEKVRTMHSN